jgi:hypothetical protein
MSLNTFRTGQRIRVSRTEFLILRKLPNSRWQLQNTATGEWCAFAEDDLLDRYTRSELSFIVEPGTDGPPGAAVAMLTSDLSIYAPELVALARSREQYLKEIDRRQPISITRTSMEPLIHLVSERIMDEKPRGWLTVWRDYRKWIAAGRDVRAIILRHAARGKSGSRMVPDVQIVSDQVIEELYMAAERKRVPEVHLEIVRRLSEANELRPEGDRVWSEKSKLSLHGAGCGLNQYHERSQESENVARVFIPKESMRRGARISSGVSWVSVRVIAPLAPADVSHTQAAAR